jgi:hypothetical protein
MGLRQPGSRRRALGCAVGVLALAGCSGDAARSRPSASIGDLGGGQSGHEGEGSSDYDDSDVVGEGETARSFVELGRLGPASLVRPLRHLFEEGRDGSAPRIGVYFQAVFSPELILSMELPELAGVTTLSLPSEAALYLYERSGGASFDQAAVAGRLVVHPGEGEMRVALEDIVMRAGDGSAEETFGSGVITGEVERVCFNLAIPPDPILQNGVPYPQHVQDESWSTPFCARYR